MASLFGRDNLPAPDRAPEAGAQDPQAEMLLTGQQLAAQGNEGNEQDVTTAAMHAECARSTDADVPRSGRSSWDAPREADGAFQGRDQHFAQNATGLLYGLMIWQLVTAKVPTFRSLWINWGKQSTSRRPT